MQKIVIHSFVFLILFWGGYACCIFSSALWKIVDRLFDQFAKREYLVLTHDGTPCTMTPGDACDVLQDADDPKAYTVKSVYLTNRQFRSLPDFQGW